MILKEENMKNKKSMFLSSLHLSPYTLFYTRFYYNHSSLYSFYVDTTPLLQTNRNRTDLHGISSLTAVKIILMAYADDVLLLLNNKLEWRRIQVILQLYEAASNGRVNYNKTTAFPLTLQPDQDLKTALLSDSVQWHDSDSPSPLIYLGYPVPICQAQINKYLDDLLSKIQRSVNIHSQRTLSVLGKAIIVN